MCIRENPRRATANKVRFLFFNQYRIDYDLKRADVHRQKGGQVHTVAKYLRYYLPILAKVCTMACAAPLRLHKGVTKTRSADF